MTRLPLRNWALLDEGCQAKVYAGTTWQDDRHAVAKVFKEERDFVIEREVALKLQKNGLNSFPAILGSGEHEGCQTILYSRKGHSLKHFLALNGGKFSLKTTV